MWKNENIIAYFFYDKIFVNTYFIYVDKTLQSTIYFILKSVALPQYCAIIYLFRLLKNTNASINESA